MTLKPLISIIVPVLNEEDNIRLLIEHVDTAVSKLIQRYDFEYVFTDNHSSDGTFDLLKEISIKDPRIRVFRFAKNFGFQASILMGFKKCNGDAAIQLDCDLQDPPELIPQFIQKWEAGSEVVYGIRRSRIEGKIIRKTRAIFYRLIDKLADDDLPHDAGDFRLISRKVIDILKTLDDTHPYLRGMIALIGFRQEGIPYDRDSRKNGVSKFSIPQLFSLAFDGILYHSITPLRIASFAGLVMASITMIGIFGYLISRFLFGADWPQGFATTTILILFSITMNALFLGIIGEYLGRIYQQIKKRPLAVIEQQIDHKKRNGSKTNHVDINGH